MAVGDGLRVADEIRRGAPVLARAAEVEAEARPHVVHREQGPVAVAEGAEAVEEAGRRRGPGLVVERRGHDHRDLAGVRLEAGAEAVQVVPGELEQVLAIVRRHTREVRQRPRARGVIRAADAHDARPSGVGPGHVDCPAGGVRAVLAEDHEVAARGERHEPLGELDHAGPGQGRQSPIATCSATAASTAGWP
jgi:hypothetical protein